MDMKRFLIAGVAVGVAAFFLGFLFHGIMMESDYMAHKELMRVDEADFMSRMPVMFLGYIILGFAFTWVYAQGVTSADWKGQGLRFGLAVAALAVIPAGLIAYTVQPWAPSTIVKSIALDTLAMVILGMLVASLYRKGAGAARATGAS